MDTTTYLIQVYDVELPGNAPDPGTIFNELAPS